MDDQVHQTLTIEYFCKQGNLVP